MKYYLFYKNNKYVGKCETNIPDAINILAKNSEYQYREVDHVEYVQMENVFNR